MFVRELNCSGKRQAVLNCNAVQLTDLPLALVFHLLSIWKSKRHTHAEYYGILFLFATRRITGEKGRFFLSYEDEWENFVHCPRSLTFLHCGSDEKEGRIWWSNRRYRECFRFLKKKKWNWKVSADYREFVVLYHFLSCSSFNVNVYSRVVYDLFSLAAWDRGKRIANEAKDGHCKTIWHCARFSRSILRHVSFSFVLSLFGKFFFIYMDCTACGCFLEVFFSFPLSHPEKPNHFDSFSPLVYPRPTTTVFFVASSKNQPAFPSPCGTLHPALK